MEDAASARDLAPHPVVGPAPVGLTAEHSLHGLAARRQLVEHADVEVAEERHRERAGDGRGGHDQHVRVQALVAERGALQHAELVLLVDDAERQA